MQTSKLNALIAFFALLSLFSCNKDKGWTDVLNDFRQRGLPDSSQPANLVGYSFSIGDANSNRVLELCDDNVAYQSDFWWNMTSYVCSIHRGKWSIGEDKNIYFQEEAVCQNIAQDQELCAIADCVATPGDSQPYLAYQLTADNWKVLEKEKWSSYFERTGGSLAHPSGFPNYMMRSYSNETDLCFNNSLKTIAYEKKLAEGIKLYREGRNSEAKHVFMQITFPAKNGDPYYYLGNVQMNLHEYKEAIRSYHYSVRHNYERHNSVFNIACAYSLLHDAKNAKRYLLYNYTRGDSNLQRIMADSDLLFFRQSPEFADFQKQIALIDSGVEPDPDIEIDYNYE